VRQDHLPLRKAGESDRPPASGFGPKKADRDPKEFCRAQARRLDAMRESYARDREAAPPYMDPSLIFKVELLSGVHDGTFRADLKRAGIDTIASAPDKDGYWVAFADDPNFTKFRQKLEKYESDERPSFIDQIESVREISPGEKKGRSLSARPVPRGEKEYVDVEVWRMEDARLEKFAAGMRAMIAERGGGITDEVTTRGFYVARARCDGRTLDDLARLREVARIDRPIGARVESQRPRAAGGAVILKHPEPGAPGILVVDSGVNNHPLLKGSIGGRKAHPSDDGGVVGGYDIDDAGHGTSVAGVALYGDIERCLEERRFIPDVWIYSAKVMYERDGQAVFDEKSLVEHQLKDAVEHAAKTYKNCRVVNISFGNTEFVMGDGKRQFRIASLIDELSTDHRDLLFVIAAGNLDDDDLYGHDHPDCLVDPPGGFRVADPATSVHGITVGSVEPARKAAAVRPSRFTRVGPGLRGMIKPELVENGGDMLVPNPQWHSDGRLFTLDRGTSLSAPAVSYMMAMLLRAFPDASRNRLTALALSSASLPAQRPGRLGDLDERGSSDSLKKILNVYGYGKPNLDYALYSDSDRVVLAYDGEIGLDRVDFFPLMLPDEFFQKKGVRSIEISLAYDPPTDANRQEYVAATVGYSLYKNTSLDSVRDAYEDASSRPRADESLGKRLRNCQVNLLPGPQARKTTTHQKSSIVYANRPRIDASRPLVLAISCQKKWHPDPDYMQKYAVVVTARHDGGIDLYNGIKQGIPATSGVEKVAV